LASRQHSSLVPFFQTSSVPFCQLSTVATVSSLHLRASGRSKGSRGKQHRHFVQFLHGSPLGKKPQPGCENGRFSDHHQKR
jgi:hypothetical protein